MLTASLSLWVALATPPTIFEKVVQLPVVHQGSLRVGNLDVPAIVHYDVENKTLYIVVVRMGRLDIEPLFIYKVPLDTLEPEQVWHHVSTEA